MACVNDGCVDVTMAPVICDRCWRVSGCVRSDFAAAFARANSWSSFHDAIAVLEGNFVDGAIVAMVFWVQRRDAADAVVAVAVGGDWMAPN